MQRLKARFVSYLVFITVVMEFLGEKVQIRIHMNKSIAYLHTELDFTTSLFEAQVLKVAFCMTRI